MADTRGAPLDASREVGSPPRRPALAPATMSLRSRLILGISLAAVVPLAVAMILLTARVRTMVETQAAERLGATLGTMRSQVRSDARRIAEKLELVGRDPMLKRLYLARPAGSRELSQYLSERRFLLGLDILDLADTSGTLVAGESAEPARSSDVASERRIARVGGGRDTGPVVERIGGGLGLAMILSAPIPLANKPAGLILGGQVFDAAFLDQLAKASGLELILCDADGRVVAATLPVPPGRTFQLRSSAERLRLDGGSYLSRGVPLEVGAAPYASIFGLASTAAADRAVASVQVVSAFLGLLGLAIAMALGALWSSMVSRPVERLAAFSERLAQGKWDEPLEFRSVRELETLVQALDRMRRDLQVYRDRLVTSERQAAWGQMARKVAHEIKNPLTPIAISVADLKRSYELNRADFPQILDQAARTVAEEVDTLRALLQEFSEYGRFPAPRLAPCRLSTLITDLEALYRPDVDAGRLIVSRPGEDVTFTADPSEIKRALHNLIQNGLEALDGQGRVEISALADSGTLELRISDTTGLTPEQRANLFVPGFTTKAQGSGLGLTIVERIVSDHGGTISVEDAPPRGTRFRIRLPLERRNEA